MKTALILATLLATSVLAFAAPVAMAGCDHSTCIGNSGSCTNNAICVLNSGTCNNSICVWNTGSCTNTATCIVNSGSSYAVGALGGVSGGKPCHSNTALALSSSNGRTTYSQYFVNSGADASPCSSGTLSLFRTYSDSDSTFVTNGNTLQIQHVAQTEQGPAFETTTLTYGAGTVHVSQLFQDAQGRPTWQAEGDLATQPAAGIVPLDVGGQ